ncbi:RNA-binding S4 domain protein [Solidesulfovibrio fructosivorans JJ]]|uniref:Pseudouridine synthase n=1 Tax=Solidesulfovibrio fructosivorans JJ] TaxID=596151 RepID=E1JYU4_SOLFR|nr:pseudouridine synthase [Solidesulfovibrio fructosivorans]EFL50514.1 RNA-binding S4 domain protein [Solidesulfovibrio fructosivorans JJ]]
MTDDNGVRLNKALAEAGVCSRRQADALIAAGRVAVDGSVVTELGRKIDPARSRLSVDGKDVVKPDTAGTLTLMLHKKPGCVTTARDPEGRPTVFDALPDPYRKRRLFSVGRLDFFSEGLLLLTTDGELAYRLAHPRWHAPKRYLVTVRGHVGPEAIEAMGRGMRLAEGEPLAPVAARIVKRLAADRFVLEMELRQGINRQVRRMCRDLGLTVLKLVRVAQGPLELGGLAPGKCRELAGEELAALRRSVGLPAGDAAPSPRTGRHRAT